MWSFFLVLLGDITFLGAISLRDREKDSNAVAMTIRAVSGSASMVPGSPQSGSCFLHHPSEKGPFGAVEMVVELSL